LFEKGDNLAIYDAINDSMNHENQKTSVTAVQALVELLTNYGPQKLDYLKDFFPNIEKLAASPISSLRAEAMNFYKEAFKFMGDALRPLLLKLKKTQQDELEKFFSENPVQDTTAAGSSGDPHIQKVDPYDFMDPVDICKRFTEAWCDQVLEQPKWSDRKASLEELLNEASTTVNIANTPHQHIAAMLMKLLNDPNIIVMMNAVKAFGALAKGLRKNFSMTCKSATPALLSKFKDKKTQIIEETMKALDNFLYCITLDEVTEDLKDALDDKVPDIKIHTVTWIEHACERNPEKIFDLYSTFLPTVKQLVNDSSAEVREAAMKLLAKWKVLLGESVIKESYNDIPAQKLQRINEFVTQSEDKF